MPDETDNSTPEDESTISYSPPDREPDRIGPYKILQKLGEGGMGVVYLAEQTGPIRRRVALKLIKLGMDSKQVIARFEAERQALALMDHPNIAKVFDAGATEQGRPYFVMEYVKGVPVTDHCDTHRLTTKERLQLFTQVCEGVQHAHQKAVIHRDIKPSNVLVSIQDGKPVPKIIDFGVAKATAQRLTEKTMFTAVGVMVGTPEYMSPEQAELTGQDVDTRTDVYSLGVMLYELLTGALPFDPKTLRKAGIDEIRRVIREEEPSRPSKRLSTLGDLSTETALKRRTDVTTLSRQLRGDLDWITMKALDKDRTRRYQSASDLAEDISRGLDHVPVLASPPSRIYRASKFVRRHSIGVAVSGAVLMLLLLFAIIMTVQAGRIARERDRANIEAQTAQRVSKFLTRMLGDVEPERLGISLMNDLQYRVTEGQSQLGDSAGEVQKTVSEFRNAVRVVNGTDLALRLIDEEILDRAGKTIDSELAADPGIAARLLHTLGDTYSSLGLWNRAQFYLERAVALRTRDLGPADLATLDSKLELGSALSSQGKYRPAMDLVKEVFLTRRRLLGAEHSDTLMAMGDFARLAIYTDDPRGVYEAEPLYKDAIAIARQALGEEHPVTMDLKYGLGFMYWGTERAEEAEPLYETVYAFRKQTLGEDHPDTVDTMSKLELLYGSLERYAEAAALCDQVIAIQERTLGTNHPKTLWSKNNRASSYLISGRKAEAESLHREVVGALREILGDHSTYTWMSLYNFAFYQAEFGTRERTIELLRQAVEAGMGPLLLQRSHWDPFRGDPDFEAIVAETEKRAAETPQ